MNRDKPPMMRSVELLPIPFCSKPPRKPLQRPSESSCRIGVQSGLHGGQSNPEVSSRSETMNGHLTLTLGLDPSLLHTSTFDIQLTFSNGQLQWQSRSGIGHTTLTSPTVLEAGRYDCFVDDCTV